MIEFSDNIPTKVAARNIAINVWAIIKNVSRTVDKSVHAHPWIYICMVLLAAIVVNFTLVSKARSERDQYDKAAALLQMKLDSVCHESATGN